MWIPSHIGIAGNKMADKLVDTAFKTILNPTITDVLLNDIKTSIKKRMNMAWQRYRNSVPSSNKLKKINAPKNSSKLKQTTRITVPGQGLDIF